MTHKSRKSTVPGINTHRKNYIAEAVSLALVASVATMPAYAADKGEVITVTATKNSESIQDVPLAITAMTGEFIDEVHLTDVKDLVTYTPGITGNSPDSFIDAISVRGIRTQDYGVGGDPSTAFFKNDLYEGRNGSAVSTLFDMDRAEVLRGPQGFLFGRNSVAGAISVHTRKAELDYSSGFLNVDIAERNHISIDGAVNVPVNENFAMRFAAIYSAEDNFIENSNTAASDIVDSEKQAFRWSTTYKKDKLSLTTLVEYEDRELPATIYKAIETGDIWEAFDAALGPVTIGGGSEGFDSDIAPENGDRAKILNIGINLEYDLGFATLTSNTGFKDHDYFYNEDYDGTSLKLNNYTQDQTGDYFQQELRLNSNSDGPLSWYVGASYYKENIDTTFTFDADEDSMCSYYNYAYYGTSYNTCEEVYAYYGYSFAPTADGVLSESNRIIGEFSGWATYVNMSYAVSDKVDVELGVRHTSDTKDFSQFAPLPESELGAYWGVGFATTTPLTDSKTWTDTSFRLLTRWKPQDDMMFFASYTQGYKAGGFASFNLGDNIVTGESLEFGTTDLTNADGFLPGSFDPEVVDSYEIGYKDMWFDGNAKVDITAYYYEYEDLQVVVANEEGGASLVKNVGQAEGKGLEGTITTYLNDNISVYLVLSVFDSEATKLQDICSLDDVNGCEGSSLFWAPEYSGALVVDADYPLENGASITASFEVFWESERGKGWENLESTKIDAFQELAMRVGYQSAGDWYVEAYVENLTDEFSWSGVNNNGGILPSHYFGSSRPRTFGVRMGISWE